MLTRQLVHKHPAVMATIALLILGLAAYQIATTGRTVAPSRQDARWFYDLETAQLFPGEAGETSTVSPDGNSGVLAMVFSCGSCVEEDARQIAFLEKYTDEGVALQTQLNREGPSAEAIEQLETARLISLVPAPGSDPQWVAASSSPGRAMMNVASRCSRGKVAICLP